MKQSILFLSAFLMFLLGVIPLKAQDYKKCVMIETMQGEKMEYYISSSPRFTQDNDKVTLTSDIATVEFGTENIKKVYVSEADYKLSYILNGEAYKTYYHHAGVKVYPEAEPTKEGYTFSGWTNEPTVMPANDVVVSGSFTLAKYKLTYKVDGEVYKTFEVDYGASITPEPAPTKEGYIFSGWSDIPKTMPAHDIVVTGTFTINKYNLIYKVDDVAYKSFELDYGTKITPIEQPTKEGYTFSGWSEIPETMPAHDVTITGSFAINSYKLIYIVDGEEYKSYDVTYGASITPEAEPTKEGYLFSGWSAIPTTMPAHDVTVTGTFSKGQYKLTYIVDGQTYKTVRYDYGDEITPEPAPTKEGYTFSGWSWIPSKMPAEDVTVTGSFTINKYKLTYKIDNIDYKSFEIVYGETITPEPAPTKEGYTFSGWSEIPVTMPARDVIVNGSFAANKYKLIYVVDGTEYKSYEVEYGASITPEPDPQKEGYTFSGWSWIPTKMPAEDVTITGSFTVNKYKANYEIDGTLYMSEEIEYGAKIVPPTPPERDGYTFAWGEYPEVMPAHDVTIIGKYTVTSGINKVYVGQGGLLLSGLQPNENVKVANTNGITVLILQANADGELTIALSSLPTGVYIVKTNRQTFKVTRK